MSEPPHLGHPVSPNAAFSAAFTVLKECPHSWHANPLMVDTSAARYARRFQIFARP